MLLDDTKYTSYVHDLDREIAEVEAQENGITFLPGIAEKLTPIPRLSDPKPLGNELVLYREPKSLTVSPEQDSVRKAVAEARERARQRQTETKPAESKSTSNPSTGRAQHTITGPNAYHERHQDDAMDIDSEL